MTSFSSLVERIAAAYDKLGHELGWRFLATPRATLSPETRIAFVGLNPGGCVYEPPVASVEAGSAYRLERWGANGAPSRIQVQMRLLYEAIGQRLGRSATDLMDETLAAHFCPFRSPGWDTLPNRAESIAFSRELWWSILGIARPSVLVCLGDAIRHLEGMLERRGYSRRAGPRELPTGWGAVKVSLNRHDSATGSSLVVGLPHLSRFGIFGRPGSDKMLEELTEAVAEAVRPPPRATGRAGGSECSTSRQRTSPSPDAPGEDTSSDRSDHSTGARPSDFASRRRAAARASTPDHATQLAARASRYLSSDHVRPAQAAVYRDLLTSGPSGDPMRDCAPGLNRQAVVSYAAGDLRYDKLPDEVRERLRRLEGQMPVASHRWPKGLLATALALTE